MKSKNLEFMFEIGNVNRIYQENPIPYDLENFIEDNRKREYGIWVIIKKILNMDYLIDNSLDTAA